MIHTLSTVRDQYRKLTNEKKNLKKSTDIRKRNPKTPQIFNHFFHLLYSCAHSGGPYVKYLMLQVQPRLTRTADE